MSLDVVRLAQDFRIPYLVSGHHHCHEGWVQVHCPFCAGGSSGWHLGFCIESGGCHCWRCGPLSPSKVLRALLPTEDLRGLFTRYESRGAHHAVTREVVHSTQLRYPPNTDVLAPAHRRYLLDRNFDPDELASTWGLRGTGFEGNEWAWRIIIPILNREGVTVSYTGRAISDKKDPRYLTLENEKSLEDPRSLLYGEQYATEAILIVEGPSDVWRLGPGAVATLGSSWTEEQAARIRRYKTRFIMFDNEIPAQRLAQRLAGAVASAPGTTEIITGLRTDPGDLTATEVTDLKRELGIGDTL